jgi:hypothetical protein
MKPQFKRTRLWVDPAFQSGLLLRMGLYLFLYAVTVLHVGFCFQVLTALGENGPRKGLGELYFQFVMQQRPLLIALIVTTPMTLYDLLKFSNRIAGPLIRCRRVMHAMASGKAVPQFEPRKRDFMRELFEAFNALIAVWNARVGKGEGANHPEENGAAQACQPPVSVS